MSSFDFTFYQFIKHIMEHIQSDRFSIKEVDQFHYIINLRVRLKWNIVDIKYDNNKYKFIITSNNIRLKMKFDRYFLNKKFFINSV